MDWRAYYGSIQNSQKQKLYGDVQLSLAGQKFVTQIERAAVLHAQFAGGLEVQSEGFSRHFKRRHLCYQELCEGIREIRVCPKAYGTKRQGAMVDVEYIIYEQPINELKRPCLENPTSGNPILENPTLENPILENCTQINKE